tara:strand:+ start:2359 stop:2874 length:516 start_codon:yes stop_codon:yes gene_type:complete
MNRIIKSPEKKFAELYEQMYKLCKENKWGDPFCYARAKEIYMANKLGHKVAPKLAGADGYEDKEMTIPVEYKSTTQKNINATYNGISVHDSWEKEIEYLRNEKICKYKNHYYARFEEGHIKEMYKISGDKVFEYITPRLKNQYDKEKKGKDPRLGVNIPKSYIINNSEKLF